MAQAIDDRSPTPSFRVVGQQWISVDGFAAGPSGEGVIFEAVGEGADSASQRWNETLLDTVDEVLLGRVSYQSFVRFWPDADMPIAARVNSVPKVVFSRTLTNAPWEGHPSARVEGDAVGYVRQRRQSNDGTLLLWGSLNLMHALVLAGELDELDLFVAPVALGAGTPILPPGSAIRLDQVDAQVWPGALHARYRIRHVPNDSR